MRLNNFLNVRFVIKPNKNALDKKCLHYHFRRNIIATKTIWSSINTFICKKLVGRFHNLPFIEYYLNFKGENLKSRKIGGRKMTSRLQQSLIKRAESRARCKHGCYVSTP